MDIAQQALMADQEALNVTSNNVANQNTAGYTREVVNFESVDAVTLSGGSVGSGVTASATSQRDRVLEQRVQQQAQIQAQSSALESALQQIQNIFGLSSTTSSASSTALRFGEQSLRYSDAAKRAECSKHPGGSFQLCCQSIGEGVFGS
jgi:flagellar hook-associated protein 1 FlgK